MSEELKSAREFVDLIWRLTGTGSDDHGLIYDKWEASIVKAVLSRDKLIEEAARRRAGEPWLFAIEQIDNGTWKDGEQCVFGDLVSAQDEVDLLNDAFPEGDNPYRVVPLFRSAISALGALAAREAEVFHNALECLVDEIETGELLTPKLKAALAEHDREIERKARLAQSETLERERCEIARIAVAIKKALQSYEWLIEGRGSYEWDDDRWHDEFKHACHNIRLELEPLEKIGADLSNRTAAASTSSDSASEKENK